MASKEEYADIIIKGAAVYSPNINCEKIDFVAIKGNKIYDLGEEGQEGKYINSKTKIYEYTKENLIMPGIHDNHIHLVLAGMYEKYADLFDTSSIEDAARKVKLFADTIPEEEWIIGFGYSRLNWPDSSFPTKEQLDELISDRPVFLLDSELHGAWVNSKALEKASIDKNTKDPDFGTIERDSEGNPTGYLCETALALVGKIAFNPKAEIKKSLIKEYLKKAATLGITSVSDMTPYLSLDLSFSDAFFELNNEGELTARIYAARDLFEGPKKFLEMREKYAPQNEVQRNNETLKDMYKITYMKQFLDGVIASYTAFLLEPYSTNPEERGSSLLALESLNMAVEEAHKNNIPVRLHGCGDAAVRAALDAYENAIKKYGKKDICHMIEHIEVLSPKDVARFSELGVIASIQPEHIVSGINSHTNNCYPEFLGKEREQMTWPFKTLLDSGAILACGSDAPVVEGNPFEGMYTALERVHADLTPVGGWNPKEKLSITEVLEGYTLGGAIAEGRAAEVGALKPGMLADIAVINKNLLTATSLEIRKAEALLTIVDGKVVYTKQ